jgi:hypothetical protein
MKDIVIRKQPRIGLGRTVMLTLHGIRYRLFRSLVTVAVIAMAVTFVMNLLSESLIRRAVRLDVRAQIQDMRRPAAWVTRLSQIATRRGLLFELADDDTAARAATEATAFGKLTPAELASLTAAAVQGRQYLMFLDELDYGSRRRLVHTSRGTAVFDRWLDDQELERFLVEVGKLTSWRLPGGEDELRAFLDVWPQRRALLERVHAGRADAIAALQPALAGRSVLHALTDADGAFGDRVRAVGFALSEPAGVRIGEQAQAEHDIRFIEDALIDPRIQMRNAVAGRLDLLPHEITGTALWQQLQAPDLAAWYLVTLTERLEDSPEVAASFAGRGYAVESLTPQRLVALSAMRRHQHELTAAERLSHAAAGGFMGLDSRMGWLVLVSLMVCVVGIANAMLMAVTERFREIATLKCLGALDGYIMTVFVIEACLLGIIGGVAGAVAGCLLGTLRTIVSFGPLVTSALPSGDLAAGTAMAAAVGVVLAALAAVYPSFKAARLAPMEAMRVE